MNPLTLMCAFVATNVVIGIVIVIFWQRAHSNSQQPSEDVRAALKSVLEWTRTTGRELEDFLERRHQAGPPLIEYTDPRQSGKLPPLALQNEEAQDAGRLLSKTCESFREIGEVLEGVLSTMRESTETVAARPDAREQPPSSADATGSSRTEIRLSSSPAEEKRLDARRPMLFEVEALPLDSNHAAAGEPFEALARELSAGGMSISHTTPSEAPYLGLHLQPSKEEPIFVIMRVQHRSSVGGVFISGGSFVRRVDAEFIESLRSVQV